MRAACLYAAAFLAFGVLPTFLLACVGFGTYIIGGITLLYCKLVLGIRPRPLETLPSGEPKRRILLVTDTSQSNTCGVLRKFNELRHHLKLRGHDVEVIETDMFYNFAVPRYEDVRLCFPTPGMLYRSARLFAEFDPDLVNILTEGNCGLVARFLCVLTGKHFTTMWCTRYDLYAEKLLDPRLAFVHRGLLTFFHSASDKVITPSPSMGRELIRSECVTPAQCTPIMNGCDTTAFSPDGPKLDEMKGMKHPIWLYVGRICHEKNVLALLELHDKIEGSIAIVGKGQLFHEAVERFASDKVTFLGWRHGEELYSAYRSADAFVFPSKTDTFGQVIIEAMASGLPVAGFPVTGPIDLVVDGCGAVDDDLLTAMTKAIATKDAQKCLRHARSFSWEEMTTNFLEAHEGI